MATTATPQFIKPWLPKSPMPKYLFTGAQLIDPVEGKVHPKSSVYVENGNIAKVEHDGAEIKDVPVEARRIDLQGKFLCPGLIDAHTHIAAVPGETDLGKVMGMPEQQAMLRMTFVCRDMLSRGFTTVRDCGGAPYALKQACDEWLVPGPRLFICGHALSQTGGHGDFRSAHDHSECAAGYVSGLGRICDGVPECLRVTRDEIRRGADFIKIMGCGGVVSPTDSLECNQLSPDEIKAIVSVANNAKTYVTCHAYTPDSIQVAISNGVRGIEHGNLMDRETAKMMAKNGCYLTPTLITYQTLADPVLPKFLTEEGAAKNKRILDIGLDALKIAKEEGVTMCYGSDLLGPLGVYQSREFRLRSSVLSAKDILQSATINPARMLRQEGVLGEIKPGYKADLLVLDKNPLEDITVLEQHEKTLLAVLKDGRVCQSRLEGLTGLLDQFKQF